jgi:hypothetical protein
VTFAAETAALPKRAPHKPQAAHPVLLWVAVHIPSTNIVRKKILVKSAEGMSLSHFRRGRTDPGADLPDETRGGGKMEVLLKSALCFSSFLRWRRNFRRQWIPGQYLLSLRRLSNHVTYLTHFIHFACSKCSNWFAGYTKDHLRCLGLSGSPRSSQALDSGPEPLCFCELLVVVMTISDPSEPSVSIIRPKMAIPDSRDDCPKNLNPSCRRCNP